MSQQLPQYAGQEGVEFYVSDQILAETERVLNYERIRKRYPYYDEDIASFLQLIAAIAHVVSPLSPIEGVVRDPNDDMVLACAVETQAQYIISRDKGLLSLGRYEDIEIVSPEDYMAILRSGV